MGCDWLECTFGDFVSIQRGHDLPDQERKKGTIPILGSFGITGYHDKAKTKGPGVTIGRSGASFGVAAYSEVDYWPLNTALYVTNFKGNNPKFVFYFMKAFDFSIYNSGSAQPSLNRNNLYPTLIKIPQPDEQRYIASILSSLDDRIALLRETNATLEAIAQAIFKSWFVDFDPVKAKAEGREPEGMDAETAALFPSEFEESELGMIPKGWRVVSVADVADVVKGKSYKSSELADSDTALITLKSFERGGGFRNDGFKSYTGSYKPEQVVMPGDCVVAYTDVTQMAEVIGRAALVLPSPKHNILVASLDVGIIRPKMQHLTPSFLYFLLRGENYVAHIHGYTSGTTVLHLAKDGVPSYSFMMPTSDLLEKFESIVEPIIQKRIINFQHAINLENLRDTLLPRLMSGQLRVPEAEQMVEGAA